LRAGWVLLATGLGLLLAACGRHECRLPRDVERSWTLSPPPDQVALMRHLAAARRVAALFGDDATRDATIYTSADQLRARATTYCEAILLDQLASLSRQAPEDLRAASRR
jgi:hypothetical protein